MQLTYVAGKSWPAATSGLGSHSDTVVGHRLDGGHLKVHEPGQRCSLCAAVPGVRPARPEDGQVRGG
jgi:hypothetical protein